MNLHPIMGHVKSYVRHREKIVGEVLFDDIPLVSAANNEIVDAVGRINLHHVPKDWLAAELYHGLGLKMRLFRNTSSQPPC
jgi:hypothetical protein